MWCGSVQEASRDEELCPGLRCLQERECSKCLKSRAPSSMSSVLLGDFLPRRGRGALLQPSVIT